MRIALLFMCFAICQFGWSQISKDAKLVIEAYEVQNPHETMALLAKVSDQKTLPDTLRNKFLLAKGIAYGRLGKSDSSNFFLQLCIENAIKMGDEFHLMRAYNSTGVLLRIEGNHESSLEAFQKAEKIALKNNSPLYIKALSDIIGNMGGIFYQLRDYPSAWKYAKRSLENAIQTRDTSALANGYLMLAIVTQAQDSLLQSLAYNKKAAVLIEAMGDFNLLAYVENNLGNLYKDQRQYEAALAHHKKANEYAKMLGDAETEAHTSLSIGESYYQLSQLSRAGQYAQNGLKIAEEGQYPIHSKNAHNLLFKIAEAAGDYQRALAESKLAVAISDSLNAAEARERLADVETKYETEKKEAEITQLSLENDLKDSRILAFGIVAMLIIVILVVFFTLYTKKQRVEKEAQELQIEALKKRFIELHSSPTELAVELDSQDLNSKLNTPLTEREFDTLRLSLAGKTNAEIAEKLFISVSTVKFHLRNTYSKMGVGNRKEAFQYMLKTS